MFYQDWGKFWIEKTLRKLVRNRVCPLKNGYQKNTERKFTFKLVRIREVLIIILVYE